jgi:hypothetical protein
VLLVVWSTYGGAAGVAAGAEPADALGSSGNRAAAAVPVTVPRLSTVDETRIVTLARTVVMAGKASHSKGLKPDTDDNGRHFPGTERNGGLVPIG